MGCICKGVGSLQGWEACSRPGQAAQQAAQQAALAAVGLVSLWRHWWAVMSCRWRAGKEWGSSREGKGTLLGCTASGGQGRSGGAVERARARFWGVHRWLAHGHHNQSWCHAAGHDGGSAAEAEEDADDEGSCVAFSSISSCLIGPGQPSMLSRPTSPWQHCTAPQSFTFWQQLVWMSSLTSSEVHQAPQHVLATPQAASLQAVPACCAVTLSPVTGLEPCLTTTQGCRLSQHPLRQFIPDVQWAPQRCSSWFSRAWPCWEHHSLTGRAATLRRRPARTLHVKRHLAAWLRCWRSRAGPEQVGLLISWDAVA